MSRKRDVSGSKQARSTRPASKSSKRMPVTVRDPLSRRVVKRKTP